MIKKLIFSLVAVLATAYLAHAQFGVQTIPPLTANNGAGGITFEVTCASSVILDSIGSVFTASGNCSVFYRVGGVKAPGQTQAVIDTVSGGWVRLATAPVVNGGTPYVPKAVPFKFNDTLFAGTTYGFYIFAAVRYETFPNTIGGTTNFTDGNLSIETGPTFGFGGGTTYPYTPTNGAAAGAARQFCGFIRYLPTTGTDAAAVRLVTPASPTLGGISVFPTVKIGNYALNTITAATIGYSFNGSAPTNEQWTGNLASGQQTDHTFNSAINIPSSGNSTFRFWIKNPNGVNPDLNPNNDTLTQVICLALPAGTYTVGGAGANYPTLQAALSEISCGGVAGAVILKLAPGTYAGNFKLENILGTATGAGSITIESTTNNAADVILENGGTGTTLRITNTPNVTINALTIKRTNTPTVNEYALRLSGGSYNGVISNCILEVSQTAATSLNGNLNIQASTNVQASNNQIIGGYYGIYLEGLALPNRQTETRISNNTIQNCYLRGIYALNQTVTVLDQNTIENISGATTSAHIFCSAIDNMTITNNVLKGSAGSYGIYMFNFDGSTQSPNLVYNNAIGCTYSNTTPTPIYLSTSAAPAAIPSNLTDFLELSHNAVSAYISSTSTTDNGIVRLLVSTTTTPVGSSLGGLVMKNNSFAAYPAAGTTLPANFRAININNAIALDSLTSDYNAYYVGTNEFLKITTPLTTYATLTDWKALTGKDANSIQTDPVYASLSLLKPTQSALDNAATPINYITTDLLGNARSTTPDIGAYEFSGLALDAGVTNILYSPKTGCVASLSDSLKVRFRNFGTNAIQNFNVSYKINNQPTVTQTYTSTLTSGGYADYRFTALATSVSGINTLKVWTSLTGDGDATNDTATVTYNIYVPATQAPTLTTPVAENFDSGVLPAYFCTEVRANSGIAVLSTINPIASPISGSHSLVLSGNGNTTGWVTPVLGSIFSSNPAFFSSASVFINTASVSKLGLSFKLNQITNGAAIDNNFRVTVNGVPVSTRGANKSEFRPLGIVSGVTQHGTLDYDLNSFITGGNIEVKFESIVRGNPTINNANIIDDLRFFVRTIPLIDSVSAVLSGCAPSARQVTADISSYYPITSASILYSLTGGAPTTAAAMTLSLTGQNKWQGTIPAGTNNSLVNYAIKIVDSQSQSDTSDLKSYIDGAVINAGANQTIAVGDSALLVGIPNNQKTVGSGTIVNTTTTYPAPYGNFYKGAHHQFLILESELMAQGIYAGNALNSLAFDVATAVATPLVNFTVKLAPTKVNELEYWANNLTTVYTTPSFVNVAGWNTHAFSSPFIYKGGNLVVDVCFENTAAFTTNSAVNQSSTPFISTLVYRVDAGGACSSPDVNQTYSQRPNIRFEAGGVKWINTLTNAVVGTAPSVYVKPTITTPYRYEYNYNGNCSISSPTTVTVTGVIAQPDATLRITSPAAGSMVNAPVTIKCYLKNLGNVPITTCGMGYTINGGTAVNGTFTGSITPSDSALYTFATVWTPASAGNYIVCITTTLTNDVNANNNVKCVTVNSNVSTTELALNVGKIYPNPTQNTIWVETHNSQTATLELYDKLGKTVHSQTINGNAAIGLSHLAQGIYSYRLVQKGTTQAGYVTVIK